MGLVFKTSRTATRVVVGGFDSHVPPPPVLANKFTIDLLEFSFLVIVVGVCILLIKALRDIKYRYFSGGESCG